MYLCCGCHFGVLGTSTLEWKKDGWYGACPNCLASCVEWIYTTHHTDEDQQTAIDKMALLLGPFD